MPLTHPPALGRRVVVTAPTHPFFDKAGKVVAFHGHLPDFVYVHLDDTARNDLIALASLDLEFRREQ